MTIRRNRVALLLALFFTISCLLGCGGSSNHFAYLVTPSLNAVSTLIVDNKSGSMRPAFGSPFATGRSPGAILAHPSKKFLYVANQVDATISLFSIDQKNGFLTEVMPATPTDISPVALAIDPSGTYLYTANQGGNSVSAYTIDPSGVLTEIGGSPFPAGFSPSALAISPSGKYLYVTNANSASVSGYSITSGSGILQPIPGSAFPTGNGPLSVAIDPAEQFVYVANSTDSTFSVLRIDGIGALAPVVGSPFLTGSTTTTGTAPVAITVDQAGMVYILNQVSNNLSVFAVDATTGFPTGTKNSPYAVNAQPKFLVFDPSGRYFFVGSQSTKDITTNSLDTTAGTLNKSQTLTVAVAPGAMSVP